MTLLESPAEVTLLEDAVLAAATLMGSPGPAEPVEDAGYLLELTENFWGAVDSIRLERGLRG